jgi:hypothetical protein
VAEAAPARPSRRRWDEGKVAAERPSVVPAAAAWQARGRSSSGGGADVVGAGSTARLADTGGDEALVLAHAKIQEGMSLLQQLRVARAQAPRPRLQQQDAPINSLQRASGAWQQQPPPQQPPSSPQQEQQHWRQRASGGGVGPRPGQAQAQALAPAAGGATRGGPQGPLEGAGLARLRVVNRAMQLQ